jgi:penicillin-binding protein 1A
MKILKILLVLFLLGGFLAAGAGVGLYYWAQEDLPGFTKLSDYSPALATTVRARDGRILGYFYREKRFLIPLSMMSPITIKAFLAAEDSGFYQHEGVDLPGIFRAAVKNFVAGSIVQGGSTITQQVIKSMLLTPERSYERKIKEIILAYRLEKYLTKDEILTIYLNQIYLGSRAYGVEAAAREYFGVSASELTLAQAAMLGGLPKAPSRYSPYANPERARERQLYVLSRLRELGWISPEEYDEAVNEPLEYKAQEDPSWKIGPYYLEEVRRQLVDMYGEDKVYAGGLQVRTTVDLDHQVYADRALRDGLRAASKRHGWMGPVKLLGVEGYEEFLGGQDVGELAVGDWTQVLVTDVAKAGAKVRFGTLSGVVAVDTMAWARTPDVRHAPEEVKDITDARKVLKAGDVVWASVVETSGDKPWKLALEQEPRSRGPWSPWTPAAARSWPCAADTISSAASSTGRPRHCVSPARPSSPLCIPRPWTTASRPPASFSTHPSCTRTRKVKCGSPRISRAFSTARRSCARPWSSPAIWSPSAWPSRWASARSSSGPRPWA